MLDSSAFFFSALQEQRWLRQEADALLAQSLAETDVEPLRAFLEAQLATDPPPLPLLHDIARSLEQRVLALRGAQADIRKWVVAAVEEVSGGAPGPLPLAAGRTPYHNMTLAEITAWAHPAGAPADDDWALLMPLVEASLEAARRLQAKSEIAAQLVRLLADWLVGHDAAAARAQWPVEPVDRAAPHTLSH